MDGRATASGFFASDTRFLSRSVLTLGGARLDPLSHDHSTPHLASFVLRNPLAGGLQPNELVIERERFVGDCMEERIVVQNNSHRRVDAELGLELAADFADIFVVKDLEPGFGRPAEVRLPSDPAAGARRRTERSYSRTARSPAGRSSISRKASTRQTASPGSRSRSNRAPAGGSWSASRRSSKAWRRCRPRRSRASWTRSGAAQRVDVGVAVLGADAERTPGTTSSTRGTGRSRTSRHSGCGCPKSSTGTCSLPERRGS